VLELRDVLNAIRQAWSSRATWVWVGDIAQWLCAVGVAWYLWSRGVTVASCVAALLACAVCQAGAVAAVVWPGRAAGAGKLVDHHRGVTVAILCLVGIFGLFLAIPVVHKVLDEPDRPMAALFVAGNALLLTSFAGLCAVTALSSRGAKGSSEQLPDDPDWVDAADTAALDD